jgi:tetratricopeptide (TPR) repeat protein
VSETPAPVEVEEEDIEPAEMPDWLHEAAPTAPTLSTAEMPDWLKEVGAEVEPHEIPDWLKESGDTEEEAAIPAPAPAAATATPVTAAPVTQPAPTMAISPAPVPLAVALSESEAAAVLTSARSQAESNVDAGLLEYEKLVRANAKLDEAVSDLSSLVKKHEKNPAVYRVLGDSLMRKGQLQAALDTYRKALNLL